MTRPLRILFIEDNEHDAELVSSHLERENIGILKIIKSAVELSDALHPSTPSWDIVLSDYELKNFNAQEALKILKSTGLDIPFVVVSGTIGEVRAIEIMKAGASDFVLNNNLHRLVPCIHREITEAKNRSIKRKIEAELKRRELQLSALLENAYAGIITAEAEGRILEFNRASERIFEVERDDVIGTSLWSLLDPQKKLQRKNVFASNGPTEFTLQRDSKSDLHLEISTVTVEFEDQPIVSYFIRDVTNSKIQRLALLESEANFRKLADSMPQIVWTSGDDSKINYANQRWYDYTGLTAEETIGTKAHDWIHPDDVETLTAAYDKAIENSDAMMSESRLRAADGSYRWYLIRSTAIRDHLNRITRWYGTSTDIHEQKIAAEELQHAKNVAESANRAKSNFLANMSHEIRTPLGAILGFAELMADPEQSVQERMEYIEIIKRNGDQLSRVISEILDLSKVESDRLQIERIRFSLPELLKDVTSLLSLQAQEKNLTLRVEFDPGLPQFIVSDPTRLRQILINIVGNAIKFTSRGEIVLSAIPLKAQETFPECIRFLISDSGLGITEEQAKHLFEPFMQGDSSMTRKFGGTGLGLALSRKLAQALGGDLVLNNSLPGQGSTFSFTIESGLTEKQQKENPQNLNAKSTAETLPPKSIRQGPDLSGTTILVVDDSPDNCSLLSYILTRAGARVDTRNDGQSGCEQALKYRYDLIFMDIQMPKMDGYEAASYLLSRNYQAPLVAITAHAMKGDRERCLSAGFRDHLTKPIDRPLLLEIAGRLSHLKTRHDHNFQNESLDGFSKV